MTRFRTYLRQHHLALLCLLLVVTGGTAYAAGALPKNSVTSKQIKNNTVAGKDLKNNSATGKDVKDGSLARTDLSPTALSDTTLIARVGTIPVADTLVLSVPGIGSMTYACASLNQSSATFTVPPQTAANVYVRYRDSADNAPVGADEDSYTATGPGGTTTAGGSPISLGEGTVYVVTPARSLHVGFTIQQGGPDCAIRAIATVGKTGGVGPGAFRE